MEMDKERESEGTGGRREENEIMLINTVALE